MTATISHDKDQIRALFAAQQTHAPVVAKTGVRERKAKLKRLEKYLTEPANRDRLIAAMQADFGKPAAETMISEIGVVLSHSRHARKNLSRWMERKSIPTPLPLFGTRNYIHYEPKGCALIISPWNYPVNLSFYPTVCAIAAGCTVTIKPSEMTPKTAAFIQQMAADLFPVEEIAVIQGDGQVSATLTALPYNHIFFTGSPAIGKLVMGAAAKNLASVSLELGGKSPCIVDETAKFPVTAQRLAWGKSFNAGQTCIAPDYLLIHESKVERFAKDYEAAVQKFYGVSPKESADFARIVNDRHFDRLKDLLDDAIERGARILTGGQTDKTSRYFAPTLLTDIPSGAKILEEEIFGPILPMISYQNLDEVLTQINSRPKPLAMYIMSRKRANIRELINRTSAGGTLINEVLLGYANPALPFGGVNNSGIGKSFGHHGFVEFSNERSILERRFLDLKMIFPPYDLKKMRLITWLHKWM